MTKTILIVCSLVYACAAFSALSERDAVQAQLGYLPTNFIEVSAWTADGQQPVAIRTYPLNGGAKRRQSKAEVPGQSINSPFPTLYWLTCPEISKAIADLEGRGFMNEIEAALRESSELTNRLIQSHAQYAEERWSSLSQKDHDLLSDSDNPSIERMRVMMRYSGISGTNFTMYKGESADLPSIKCLHAHYAHWASTAEIKSQNPVGEMIRSALRRDYPGLQL